MRANTTLSNGKRRTPESLNTIPSSSSPTRLPTSFRPSNYGDISYKTPTHLRNRDLNISMRSPTSHTDRLSWLKSSQNRDTVNSNVRLTEVHDPHRIALDAEKKAKITLLAEIHRLERIVKEKTQENEARRQKEVDLEERIKILVLENERLSSLVDEYSNQIEIFKMSAGETAQDSTSFRALMKRNQDLEYQVERLNETLVQRLNDINMLRNRLSEEVAPSVQLSSRHRESVRVIPTGMRIVGFEEERRELEVAERKALNAIKQQTRDLESMQRAYRDLEDRLNQVTKENERLKDAKHPKNQELEMLRSQFVVMQDKLLEKKELESQLQFKTTENDLLKGIVEEMKGEREVLLKRMAELEGLRSQIKGLEDKVAVLITENDQLRGGVGKTFEKEEKPRPSEGEGQTEREILRRRIQELENLVQSTWELRDKVLLLADDNERLREAEKEKESQIELFSKKLIEIQEEYNKIIDVEVKMNLLVYEREAIFKAVQEKQIEINEWKSKYLKLEEYNNMLKAEASIIKDESSNGHGKFEALTSHIDRLNRLIIEQEKVITEGAQRQANLENVVTKNEELIKKIHHLSVENERLGNKLVQQSRQIEESVKKCTDLETEKVLIRGMQTDLQAEKQDLEGKIELMIKENMQLNTKVMERARQIDELQARIEELEHEKSQFRNDDLINHYEQLKEENQSLRNALKSKKQTDTKPLSPEKDQMKEIIQDRSKKNENSKAKARSYNPETDRRVPEKEASLVSRVQQLENEIQLLAVENSRLNNIVEEKSKVIHELQTTRRNELQMAQDEFRSSASDLSHRREELDEKVRLLEIEKRQIHSNLMEKIKQVEDWEIRYHELQNKVETSRNGERDLTNLKEELERFRKALNDKSAETEKLRETIFEQKRKLEAMSSLENKANHLKVENERLEKTLGDYTTKIEEFKYKQSKSSIHQNEAEELKRKVSDLKRENEILTTNAQENSRQIEEWRNKYWTLKKENDEYQDRIESLANENKFLSNSNSNKLKEIQDLSGLVTQLEGFKRKAEQVDKNVEALLRDNERLNQILDDKMRELDQNRIQLSGLQVKEIELKDIKNQVQSLLEEKQRVNNLIDNMNREVYTLKDQNTELQRKQVSLTVLDERINDLAAENQRLNSELAEKILRIMQLEKGEAELEGLRKQIHWLNMDNEDLSKKVIDLNAEMNTWAEKSILFEKSQNIIRDLEGRVEYLSRENKRISQELLEKPRLLAELQKKEDLMLELKQEIQNLYNEKEEVENLFTSTQRELESIREKLISKGIADNSSLDIENKFGRLLNENKKLIQVVDENNQRIQNLNQELDVMTSPGKRSSYRDRSPSLPPKFTPDRYTSNITYNMEFESPDEREENDQELDLDALNEEDKMGLLVEEVERLQNKINRKNKAIEALKSRVIALEENCQQMSFIMRENEKLKQVLEGQKKGADLLGIRSPESGRSNRRILTQDKENYDELASKIIILGTEVERLNRMVLEREREIERLKFQERKSMKGSQSEVTPRTLELENDNIREALKRKIEEVDELRNRAFGAEKILALELTKNQQLSNELEEKRREIMVLKRISENPSLVQELEDVVLRLKSDNEALIRKLKEKELSHEADYAEQCELIRILQTKIVLFCIEIERLSNLLAAERKERSIFSERQN